ncbi:C3 and PZP-like alpha-2-macroglobulin domain-containing protein 8 isoform X1 [Diaphorina citri]|uniref:C3 and PZP-like alpha-2-macroglobulin domain-containing protein 8 isoform X1 n=1 Tax=Diaphorina citri TaxID=121845 RepID=A0A1S3DS32_DIACI|nr:C3 and PZP-like alpha-2-macroglobulin domain-containing protein 8 isoform X1 [Diaphorina citri]
MNSLISELKTEDKLEYQFFPLPGPTLKFQVKANNDAHIAFTQALGEGEPMYEVFIGGWNNSKSAIRKNKQKPDVATVETPGILTEAGHKGFWITVRGGTIFVGYDGESSSFLSYQDPEPFPVHYYGVCTGWGATGEWFIEGKCLVHYYGVCTGWGAAGEWFIEGIGVGMGLFYLVSIFFNSSYSLDFFLFFLFLLAFVAHKILRLLV